MKSLKILVVVHESLIPPASIEGYTEQQIDEWRTVARTANVEVIG